jgi:hypothetical protein
MSQKNSIIETEKRTALVHYRADSLNEDQRTVDFVLATDAPADFGAYFEILGMEDGEIRSKRLDDGIVPVLDSHPQSQWKVQTVDDQFGVVTKWKKENGSMVGTCKFAKDERSERAFQKVKEGILRTGSVGYIVYGFRDVTPPEVKKKTYRAIDWELLEFSLVSIPADPDAKSRNQENEKYKTKIVEENSTLNERTQKMGKNDENENAEQPTAAEQIESVRVKATADEQGRIVDIQTAVRSAGLEDDLALDLITRNLSLAEASKEIFTKMAAKKKESASPAIDVNHRAEEKNRKTRISDMVTAIEHRVDSAVKVEGQSREFAGMSLFEMAKECVRATGKDVRLMDRETVIRQAFQGTSDFPTIAGAAMEKKIKLGYDSVVDNFKPLISETSRSDFKTGASVSLSDAPSLGEIKENGEFETGTFTESKEQYKIGTYGKRIALTRQVIINDDMGIFNKIPVSMGASGGRTLHALVWGFLNAAHTMGDGVALFHATHKNLAANAADLEAAVKAMLLLLRKQTAPKGAVMNYNPGYLVVGADYEIEGRKLVTQTTPASAADVNVYANTLQGLIVESSIAAKKTFLTGRKGEVDMIEVAWLNGQRGVNIRQRENSNILGVEWDIFMDVGAKPQDHRGLYSGGIT